MDTLDKYFRALTKPVFDRHGFGLGELIARWPEIAGEALAELCEPEKIRWPRGAQAQKLGGTLHLTAAAGRALEVQYATPRIVERVNGFLGYGAIAAVKIAQGQFRHRAKTMQAPLLPAPRRLTGDIDKIEDPALKAALTRLAAGVASRTPSSPQGQ